MKCPACENVLEEVIVEDITVDVCKGGCGGIWLEAGELGRIQSLFKTEEERNKATDDYFSEIFDNQLSEMNAQAEKTRNVANMFRFICRVITSGENRTGGLFSPLKQRSRNQKLPNCSS